MRHAFICKSSHLWVTRVQPCVDQPDGEVPTIALVMHNMPDLLYAAHTTCGYSKSTLQHGQNTHTRRHGYICKLQQCDLVGLCRSASKSPLARRVEVATLMSMVSSETSCRIISCRQVLSCHLSDLLQLALLVTVSSIAFTHWGFESLCSIKCCHVSPLNLCNLLNSVKILWHSSAHQYASLQCTTKS